MNKKINPDIIRLNDILKMIDELLSFSKDGLTDRKTIMAVAYGIAIIGEAAGKISDDIIKRHSEIPWKEITGMRHRIIHNYGNVNLERLKEAVEKDLPDLKPKILKIVSDIKSK